MCGKHRSQYRWNCFAHCSIKGKLFLHQTFMILNYLLWPFLATRGFAHFWQLGVLANFWQLGVLANFWQLGVLANFCQLGVCISANLRFWPISANLGFWTSNPFLYVSLAFCCYYKQRRTLLWWLGLHVQLIIVYH